MRRSFKGFPFSVPQIIRTAMRFEITRLFVSVLCLLAQTEIDGHVFAEEMLPWKSPDSTLSVFSLQSGSYGTTVISLSRLGVRVHYSNEDAGFSIHVPSKKFFDKMEGLCGSSSTLTMYANILVSLKSNGSLSTSCTSKHSWYAYIVRTAHCNSVMSSSDFRPRYKYR